MADLAAKFAELNRMKYADQAKWFLNGFWDTLSNESEAMWKCTQKFIELDVEKKANGSELDEFYSHKFLESLGETLTVLALRDKLKKIDLDCDGKMALLEYLTFRYKKNIKEVVNAPQGGNQKEVNEAADKLQAVQDALKDLQLQLEQQHAAVEAQKAAEAEQKRTYAESMKALEASTQAAELSEKASIDANQALEAQRAAEEIVKKAEADLRAAVDDLNSQEEKYKTQITTLETKSKDPTSSTVTKNKAAAELAQLKQEDPLPLRKAKITQEAALRKVEKDRKASEIATANAAAKAKDAETAATNAKAKKVEAEEAAVAAEAAAKESEEKTRELEAQKARVEESVRETEARYKEAQDYLESVKAKGGAAKGAIWWMERELVEAQKYLPKRRSTSNADRKYVT